VREWTVRDPRITLVIEAERRGKARAINRFLAGLSPKTRRCVMISGDVLPAPGTLARLLAPLADPDVRMTGARPVPTNPRKGLVQRIVHLQWMLHDRVARHRPKLGEMVAFRPPVEPLDPDTPVDEAALEAQLHGDGGQLVYVPQAIVFNRGPSTWRDLFAQRERIWAGHLRLRRRTGYRVATYRLRDMIRPTVELLWTQPSLLLVVILAAGFEVAARLRATFRHRLLGHTPTVWPVLESAKVQTP